jgi:hypothetical protein
MSEKCRAKYEEVTKWLDVMEMAEAFFDQRVQEANLKWQKRYDEDAGPTLKALEALRAQFEQDSKPLRAKLEALAKSMQKSVTAEINPLTARLTKARVRKAALTGHMRVLADHIVRETEPDDASLEKIKVGEKVDLELESMLSELQAPESPEGKTE